MSEFAKSIVKSTKQLQQELFDLTSPRTEGEKPKTNYVIDFALVARTRGYLERLVNQINGTYEHAWYDACAVMLRRLIETLIIEVFEAKSIAAKIQDSNQDYFHLAQLISLTLTEKSWHLGRNAKRALPKLKDIGDQSAHSRRFNANRNDIEQLLPEIRTVVQELVSLAGLK